MAERRMFAKSVMDSDDFMSLPFSAQAVYVHLAMRADDDGFVGNAKSILRMVGGGSKEFNLLTDKGYIRVFDSGVVAIVHWKTHNYIQKDRYKPSIYREEKAQMYPDNDKNDEANSCVSNPDTQDRIGKDRLGKDSTDKDSTGKDRLDKDSTDEEKAGEENADEVSTYKDSTAEVQRDKVEYDGECKKIFDMYNSICTSLPQVGTLTYGRKYCISRLLKKYTPEQVEQVFRKAQSCDFLCGKGTRGWKATFDWLINEDNFLKVSEGAYECEQSGEPPNYDLEAYEKYSIFD